MTNQNFDKTQGDPAIAPLLHAIANRRSLGLARLKPDAVDTSLIETMLEAANWAPSHGETEPWRFTVFTGEGRRLLGDAFAAAYQQDADRDGKFRQATLDGYRDRATSAPVWISLGMTPARQSDGTLLMREEEELLAVACAIQNLHLVASALGLAGMWHSKGVSVHPHVAEFLGLTPPSRLLGFFFLGWPAVPWPEGERGPVADKVTWVTEAQQTPQQTQ